MKVTVRVMVFTHFQNDFGEWRFLNSRKAERMMDKNNERIFFEKCILAKFSYCLFQSFDGFYRNRGI